MNHHLNARRAVGALALALSSALAAQTLPADPAWQAILRDPTTAGVEILSHRGLDLVAPAAKRAEPGTLASRDTLRLPLGGGRTVEAMKLSSTLGADGVEVWRGLITDTATLAAGAAEIADDPRNSAIIVRNGSKLTGSLRVDGQLYRLLPLHDGTQVVVKIDESRMPPEHPVGQPSGSQIAPRAPLAATPRWRWDAIAEDVGLDPVVDLPLDKATSPTVQANTTIRVMVVATKSAATASGDITGLVNLAIAESNTGYANSGVQITVQLAGLYTTAYAESGSFDTDLSRFRGTRDGYMDNIHSLRTQNTADVAMLIINNSSSCGLASAIGATASTAFAAVHHGCATGYYSFAHEIGHLQSARHDPTNDPTNTPYAYGHGFQSPTKAWRTVMAYNCSPSCPRVNYWSNPTRTYQGQAMGTTTRNDNARVLNNTRATISAFR